MRGECYPRELCALGCAESVSRAEIRRRASSEGDYANELLRLPYTDPDLLALWYTSRVVPLLAGVLGGIIRAPVKSQLRK